MGGRDYKHVNAKRKMHTFECQCENTELQTGTQGYRTLDPRTLAPPSWTLAPQKKGANAF